MTYTAGIIGAGGIAGLGILGMHDKSDIGKKQFHTSHAGGYRAADGIELVAIADTDPEKLDRFGEAWEISSDRRYPDHEAMLAAETLDVVSVCTPTMFHHRHVIDSVRSSTAPSLVWCEKPIDSQVRAAQEMIEVCSEHDVELVVNHSFRFTDKMVRLRELLESGSILGEPIAINAQFRMELLRNSTHLLDSLVYLLDIRPNQVAGYITGENEAVETLPVDRPIDDAGGGGFVVTENGTFIAIDCTVPREPSSMAIHIIGTDGKLYLNNDDGEWRYWALDDGNHRETELPGIAGAWTWERDYHKAFENAATHIVSVLDGTERNRSPGTDAIRSLEVIIGFYLSHYTGGRVTIPLDSPLKDVRITSW